MDMKTKVAKYSAWYEVIDAMRGIESIPVSELLQMAFSAGVEAAEQSVQSDECPHCHARPAYTDQQTYPDICSECGTRR